MKNLVLITSVINIPNIPLSYTNIRSVYTCEERFIQTKKTIESLRKMIPDLEILLVECSDLKVEYEKYLKSNCEHYINLHKDIESRNKVFSKYKAVGETELIIKGIEYIELNSLIFDNFFKISGRFYLSDSFDYNFYTNKEICCVKFENNIGIHTIFYKIPYQYLKDYYNFLMDNLEFSYIYSMEHITGLFVNKYEIKNIEKFNVKGNIAVCGTFLDY